jgi:hypothetical protein
MATVGLPAGVGDARGAVVTTAVAVAFCCTTGAGAVATIGAVAAGAAGWGAAPPNTKTLPKIMLAATIPPKTKFIVFARDHFFERPFGRRDFFAMLSSNRTYCPGL